MGFLFFFHETLTSGNRSFMSNLGNVSGRMGSWKRHESTCPTSPFTYLPHLCKILDVYISIYQ